ncbi:MAG: OmpA family protein [Bacteroidales bacterium]|nr:OmpA family protein [Bacteroidales bacterium]
MKKITIIILFILMAVSTVFAQKAVRKADSAFAMQQYNYAVTLYQKAFSKIKKTKAIERNRINYQIAEAYRLSGQYKKAVPIYNRIIKAKYFNIEPNCLLHLAEIQRFNGDYEKAVENYEIYLELVPDDKDAIAKRDFCAKAKEYLNHPTKYETMVQKKLSSRSNDYAPRYLDTDEAYLTFTSTRDGVTGKKLDDWTGQRFSDIFVSTIDPKGAWSTPVLIDEEKIFNTSANESDAFFINDGATAFFTFCPIEKGKKNGCHIFKTDFDGSKWSSPEMLQLCLDSTADCVHPWVSNDANLIFFASNMTGGEGDLDIYYAQKGSSSNGLFGDPVNLGKKINTSGKEAWPFLRGDTALYFASTGHLGMGGYDIFKSVISNNKWSEPENMMYPINSSADDFGIIFSKKHVEKGFFSSNRSDGVGNDDIYSFELPQIQFSISGLIRDDENMQLIDNVIVQIVGSDGLNIQTNTDKKGFYRFDETQIKKDVTYKLWASKSGYLDVDATETTVNLKQSKDITRDFRLQPIPKGAIVLPDIYYDLAKWDLKEQYQDSLIGLITLLEQNPRLVVELASHTDSRPIAMTNDTLSQYRAAEVVKYLIFRGIHPGRLIAKGYGSNVPRQFKVETVIGTGNDTVIVPANTPLNDEFVKSLPRNKQEIAHQANRRTEFSILRDDFVPPVEQKDIDQTTIDDLVRLANLNDENRIKFRWNGDFPEMNAVANGVSMNVILSESEKSNKILWSEAMRLLKIGKLNKNNFTKGESAFNEDGDIVLGSELTLQEVKIGKEVLKNVKMIVADDVKSAILLNGNTLKTIGSYSLHPEERFLLFEK